MEIKLTHVKTTNLTDISITIPSSVITVQSLEST